MKKLKPMRLLVCGGRDYGVGDNGRAYAKVVYLLNKISVCGVRKMTIIHGGAKGADALAGQWAFNTNTPHEVYPADWYPKNDGVLDRSAGIRRNEQMLIQGKPDVVLAFPGGKGTAHMVAIAKAAGIKVIEVPA